jgi:alpha-mannosidase
MKIRFGLIGIIIILLNLIVFAANTDGKEKMNYLQGYAKAILGGGFGYHSPHPDISKSLLVRHKSGENYIKWETEVVPQNYDGEYVSFIWYFGIDHRANENEFKLYINDELNLTFNNKPGSELGNWSVEGKNNTKLTFNATMIDKYSDLMGIATLQIPVPNLNKGEPVVLAVEGEDAGKQSWYMTFEGKVEKEISLTQSEIIVKENDDNYLLLDLNIVHLEGKEDLEVKLDNGFALKSTVQTGFNSFNLTTPKSLVGKEITAEIKIGTEEPVIRRILLEEVREWFVNLVMHSHTDIGYTRPQTEILPEHLRYIDYALDFCDLTDNYPDDAKFRWTCESSWPLQEYLKSRPKSQIDRLRSRVTEGRIQLTAMMFNLSEMADEVLLAGMLKPVKQIRNAGLNIECAMQNDINGIGWCFVDFFNGIGIKYLIMGEHGHRALIPFDYPTPFWWQSPSGEKILAYRTDHYMTGNMIGIHTGNLDLVKESLMIYLGKLSKTNYPYNDVHIQMSGYFTDNSPPSLIACDLVREWNKKYEWPKLRISTASEFIRKIEKEHSTNLPVIQAAWPDWWADGFGSAARETAESRRVQGEINANCGLLSMAALLGADLPEDIEEDIYSIQQNLLFYAEHTFGYS